MELDLPNPIHIIHDSRYARQDGWQLDDISLCSSGNIAVSGHRGYPHYQSYVFIYSSIDDNSDSRDKPTLLYHKQFTDKPSWEQRCISFIKPNSTEIVTCQGDEVQVIDYNRDVVLRSRKVNGDTTCLSVSENQIFIGLWESDIVNIYDNDLNRIKSIRLKGIRGDWPRDIVAAADRLYVCTGVYPGRAIVYSQYSGNILTEYTTGQYGSKAYSIAVNIQLQIVAVLWDRKHVSVYSFSENDCLVDFDVESGVNRIRISDRGRIVTGNENSADVKIYDLKDLVFENLSVKLAELMSSSEINELSRHFNVLNIKLDQSSDSDEDETSKKKKKKNVKNVMAKLDEQGILYPNKANQLKTPFENLSYLAASKLSGPIHLNQKYASTFADTLQTDQLRATAGRFNDSVSLTPSHEIPEGRFAKQDNWQNMNMMNAVNTRLGLVCYVRSGKKREENVLTQLFKLPNFNSTVNPQLIYSKVIKRQGYKKLFLTFIDDTHLVMCYNKTLEVIDINSTEVVRGHRLCAAAKTMVVEEGEIFIIVGDSSEILVFSPDLEEVEKLTFNFKDWKYPTDMKVTPERVFIICKIRPHDHDSPYHWPDRAISFLREDGEMEGEFIFPGNRYTDPISIAAHKESKLVGVLWSKTYQIPRWRWRRIYSKPECMISLHTFSGSCVFLLDVKHSHSIQILNKNIMIVINQTDGLKYYNMAYFFTYNTLALQLSSLVTLPECTGLQNFCGISDEEMNRQDCASSHNRNLSRIRRRFLNLMKILEEKGLAGPNKFDDFIAAYKKVRSNLLWDHVDAYVKFQAGSHQQPRPAEFAPARSQHQSLEQTKQPAQHSLQHGEEYAGAFQSELVAEQHPAVVQQTQQTAHQLSASRKEPQLLVAEQHPAAVLQGEILQLPASRQHSQLQHPYQQQWHQEQLGYNKRLQHQQLVGYTSQPSCSHRVDMHLPQQVTSPQSCSYPVAFSPQQQPQDYLHNQQQAAYDSQIVNRLPAATSDANPRQQQHVGLSYLQQHHDEQVLGQKEQQPTSYQAQKSYQHQEDSPSQEAFVLHAEHITSRQGITLPSSTQHDQEELQHPSGACHFSALEGSFIMDKKCLFVQCLKRRILYLTETRNFTPWGKFSRWKSTDLFVSCWMSLIDRKSMTNVKGIEDQLKLKYTEIFTHDKLKSETRIAIQGGPGSGKTTLLSQLALDWSKGKLTNVDVLVYMPLKTVNDKPLIQAIKNFYIPENIPVSETDIESILASDAETICLLLDGLEDNRSGRTMGAKQSSDVWRILKKEAFPNCKVVVTSHSYFIQDIFDGSLLKIGEFGETERNSYIEKLSQGNIKREEKLKQLIEDDSFLLGLFNVPLFFSLAVENIESMGLASDSLFDKVTPFVQNIVETLFVSSMSGPETWSESEQLTLGGVAFNGLCKELKQASWSSNFIETKTSRLKHWLDCRILAVEHNLTEQPGKEYQDTDGNNEMSNRENMEHVTEQIGLQTYQHGGSKDKETSQSLGNVETQQHARYRQGKEKQSYEATVRIRFLHEVFQELFAATYMCSMMNHYADEDQFHEYVIKQLQKLNPEDLLYILRFTSYLLPRSCSVIINYLLTNFLPKDGGIPSHIMDCIFLCFAEHNGTKGPDIKNSITEVCKEVITIDYEDGRFLQKAKTSLLQYASACGITIEEVRLDNVISAVDDTFLTFNSGTKLEPLDTLQLIEVSQEDQVFHQDDFGNILKHCCRGNSIKTILCIFPCNPPKIVDDIIIENVKLKNIEVEWNNGEVIWTLDPAKQIFLPIYDLMKKAGHFELKSMEYDPKPYEHFPMSLPHTSLKSFGKWPTKRPLSKLTHSDTKLDFKAKRLKANWNLKVKNETEYKKEQDEEEILDLSKEEPSTSYNREKILKDEGHSQDVSIMKIKAEPFWDDSEQDICTLKDEPSTSYDEGKFLTEEGPSQDVSPVIIKEETSKTDSEQDIWTVKEEPLTSNDEEEFVKEETPSHDYSSAPNEEETSESSPEQDIWRMNTTGHFEESQHTSPHGRRQLQAQEVITQFGGTIHIPDTDIVLNVPPDALPENMQECLISMRIIPLSMSHDESTSFSSNSSVRVELLPNHLKFRCHIELTLPHCLVLKKNVVYRARVFQSHHSEGERPQWEEQRDQPYDLQENICIIWLKSFCWIKFDIDDEIVEGKRLKLYTAATKMYLADMYASVEVGYHLDMPGEQEILKMNPKLILAQRKPFVFLREGQHPLFIRLARIIPHQWKYSDRNPKEIPFHSVAASVEYSCPFVVEKETQDRDIPLCVFVAAQVQRIGKSVGERTVELIIRPEVHPFATPWDVR